MKNENQCIGIAGEDLKMGDIVVINPKNGLLCKQKELITDEIAKQRPLVKHKHMDVFYTLWGVAKCGGSLILENSLGELLWGGATSDYELLPECEGLKHGSSQG